ncbi:MAG: hypothetical protein NMNS01_03490 [Nitrosomonas sp.]|nr:MAG: hypothetical protein NMNS01_03490 [Nitrosomonas sp.]
MSEKKQIMFRVNDYRRIEVTGVNMASGGRALRKNTDYVIADRERVVFVVLN